MPSSATNKFVSFNKEFVKALDDRRAALFIGSGMSRDAGMPTWSDLLRDVASELNLDVDKEADLVALAQFHINEKRVRSRLNQLIVDEYGRDVPVTANHHLIATLPIETVWTTNYDTLIERGFHEAGKRCDVRITKGNFSAPPRGKDVTIYKMHGDVSMPEDATLTKDDYEIYSTKHEIFSSALRGDLVTKTFLFLGFSLTDPNIDYILSRIRLLMGQDAQQHYCVMRWPDKPKRGGKAKAQYDYDMVRLQLRISDLKRYGIEALMIDRYDEVTEILQTLNKRAHRKNVFVSGSAHTYAPLDQQRVDGLAHLIGQQLIKRDYNLVSGFGLGIGGTVLIGAAEEVYRSQNASLADRVVMRPFPQLAPDNPNRQALYTNYRRDMLSTVGYAVFLCGNKLDAKTGKTVAADGARQEFKISQELGKVPIPVGATGDVAKEIWDEVMAAPTKFYPGVDVIKHLVVLGDTSKTNAQLVDAVFAIIRATSER